MMEVDLGFDAQPACMRPQFAKAAIGIGAYRLEHLDVAPANGCRHNAGLVDGGNESRGAAVHERNFRPVDLDDRVVDTEAIERRHDVFGGGDGRTGLVAEPGSEPGGGDRTEIGHKLAIRLALAAATHEDDAGVSLRWMQRDGGGPSGMHANAGNGHVLAQGCLPASLHAPCHALHLIAEIAFAIRLTPSWGVQKLCGWSVR